MPFTKNKCGVEGCKRPQKAVGSRKAGKYPVYDKDGFRVRWQFKEKKTLYSTYCDKHRFVKNRPPKNI